MTYTIVLGLVLSIYIINAYKSIPIVLFDWIGSRGERTLHAVYLETCNEMQNSLHIHPIVYIIQFYSTQDWLCGMVL